MGSLGSLQLYAHVLPPPDTELPADSLSKHHRSLPARPWSGTDVEKGSWCVGCAFQELGKEEQALRLARSYSSQGHLAAPPAGFWSGTYKCFVFRTKVDPIKNAKKRKNVLLEATNINPGAALVVPLHGTRRGPCGLWGRREGPPGEGLPSAPPPGPWCALSLHPRSSPP